LAQELEVAKNVLTNEHPIVYTL